MDALFEFEARYYPLAVTTCEWRAFEMVDPELLARRVFSEMRARRRAPTLAAFYKTVEEVVAAAYRDSAAGNSLFAGWFRMQLGTKRPAKTDTDLARDALAALRMREVILLRQAFWDGLTPAEMAQVNGGTPETQSARLAEALRRYASKLPTHLASEPEAALDDIHPGMHRRTDTEPPEVG